MLIGGITLDGIGPIREEPLRLKFDPQVNVLIGPNACGKSTIIDTLALLVNEGPDADPYRSGWEERAFANAWPVSALGARVSEFDTRGDDVAWAFAVRIPSIRLPFPSKEEVTSAYITKEQFDNADNVLDGREVRRAFENFGKAFLNAIDGFDFAGWTRNGSFKDAGAHKLALVAERQLSIVQAVTKCSAEICREVLLPEIPQEHSHRPMEAMRGVSEVTLDFWKEHTTDIVKNDQLITTGDLSSGTQGPKLWIWHIAIKVHEFFMRHTGGDLSALFVPASDFNRLSHWLNTGEGLDGDIAVQDDFNVLGLVPNEFSGWDMRELDFALRVRSGEREYLDAEEYNVQPDYNFLSWLGFEKGDEIKAFLPNAWKIRIQYSSDHVVHDKEEQGFHFSMSNHDKYIDVNDIVHDEWRKMPFVLLIDEIENHLHPTWQRRVIPALLKWFPNMQIIATTHSPFVVAGLKAGQVHLLNRDADGVITASTNTEDIVGWTADEILRTMMGVEDPTDDATAAAARELRQLRDAGPSADERDEEQRQARMQELRRMVDRDLLAGGPMAARRERFEQDFTAALEKYRQSQSLDQDGG